MKRQILPVARQLGVEFSPAFCGGLIEAYHPFDDAVVAEPVFPRVLRGPH